ncbi:tetratricopeptide repeat protein [Actinomyces vulturis]|uniref:tetratricopeptide repeat protein n=1 Tax=Actinomyces vulturis TaxID=1857645 RepID=UPI00082EBE22|nr:tetratricopeptide repeat protein [Actinomyces vulturis]
MTTGYGIVPQPKHAYGVMPTQAPVGYGIVPQSSPIPEQNAPTPVSNPSSRLSAPSSDAAPLGDSAASLSTPSPSVSPLSTPSSLSPSAGSSSSLQATASDTTSIQGATATALIAAHSVYGIITDVRDDSGYGIITDTTSSVSDSQAASALNHALDQSADLYASSEITPTHAPTMVFEPETHPLHVPITQARKHLDAGRITEALMMTVTLGPQIAEIELTDSQMAQELSSRAHNVWTDCLDAFDAQEARDAVHPMTALDEHFDAWHAALDQQGSMSPRAAHEQGALGRAYHRCRHESEALEYLRPAANTMRYVLGELHPETLHTRAWLGITYLALGDVDAGEAELRATRDAAITLYGLNHPRTAPIFMAHAGAVRRLTHPEWPINPS